MSLTSEKKSEVIGKYASRYSSNPRDTGSTAVQVALITERLNHLQGHFETHKKDHSSRRGLLKLVGQRRRLLDYLRSRDVEQYRKLIQDLGVRK